MNRNLDDNDVISKKKLLDFLESKKKLYAASPRLLDAGIYVVLGYLACRIRDGSFDFETKQ